MDDAEKLERDKLDRLERDARLDNEARAAARLAVNAWLRLGYTQDEIIDFVNELVEED